MAKLRLPRRSSVCRGCHAQRAIAGWIDIVYEAHAVPGPNRVRHAGPARFRADDPAVIDHAALIGVGEVVE